MNINIVVCSKIKKCVFLAFYLWMTLRPIYTQESEKVHHIPSSIETEALEALHYYPELASTPIHFKFKKDINKSIMQAQPTFWSLFKAKKNRRYKICISQSFQIEGSEFSTEDIPKNVLMGWFAHELGHIMDYRNRSKLNLLWFGIKYAFSENYIKEAERTADTYAVEKNMDHYIIATKKFILNHSELSHSYKQRIKKYYLSPDEILDMVSEREIIEN